MNHDLEIRMATEAGRWGDVVRLQKRYSEDQPREADGKFGSGGAASDKESTSATLEAQSKDTGKERLHELSKHEDPRVRRAVAMNPNARVDTLINLAKDKDKSVSRWAKVASTSKVNAYKDGRSYIEQPRQTGGQWHGLKVGDRVQHETDGSGRVVEVNNDDLTVEHDLFAGQLKRWSASKVSKLA